MAGLTSIYTPKHSEGGERSLTAHPDAQRGRGAVTNASGRYEGLARELIDDGWGALDALPPPLRTTVSIDTTRTIITRNDSPDLSFDRSINPYRGCEHGCIYCFARPTHAYLGLSPGLDFESRLTAKPEAAKLLRQELAKPTYKPAVLAIGTNTDPYQPIEKRYCIMRQVLEVLNECNHPVAIVTKSVLILRDLDLLTAMARKRLVKIAISVTSLDRKLARAMEPRAATPERRIEAIKILSQAGVPTASMVAPIIPALNDWEIERILERVAEVGASEAGYVLLRLPLEIKDLFKEWLTANTPDRAEHVMSLVRQTRGGREYDAEFGKRQIGEGPYARLIGQRFRLAIKRFGLNQRRLNLDLSQFRPPNLTGQLNLF